MRALVVLAHPLAESFAHAAAARVADALGRRGFEVDLLDLYAEAFDPVLSARERRAYFAPPYDSSALPPYAERLRAAHKLALVFPQWWFDAPAILKGFFDRALAPGVAFAHGPNGRPTPLLTQIDALWAVTSTGAPWWFTRFVMGDPVRRQLSRGMKPWLCPKARFRMFTLDHMDTMTRDRAGRFLDRLEKECAHF
ncbi:NAD(P)H-dependent oxidoreductase [Methylocella sp.]|uniref:NAD(P)H-dependent oxidoreductase n=1 Tax=Methylocella sp. TaxID=1978226 RepID=UPI0037845ABF